ncbi:MAG: exodeoxyribonuclease III, partial [Pseudomonadota bacterium]
EQARYLEVLVSPEDAPPLRLCGLYLPNGNPTDGPKYPYKLAWMDRLIARAKTLIESEERFVLAGDFNVIPRAEDVHDPAAWAEDALFRPETRAKFFALKHLGLTDAIEACHAKAGLFTFWDYQGGAWNRDHGIRIDHLLLSPQASDGLVGAAIDRDVRGWEKPSDHVPVWAQIP